MLSCDYTSIRSSISAKNQDSSICYVNLNNDFKLLKGMIYEIEIFNPNAEFLRKLSNQKLIQWCNIIKIDFN